MADDILLLRSELKLDVQEAEKKVADIKKKLDLALTAKGKQTTIGKNLKGHIESLKKELASAKKEADRAKKALNDLDNEGSKSLSELDVSASRVGRTLGAVFSVAMAKEFVMRMVQTRSQFQQLEVAFTTLLKSEEKANKLMSDAIDLAAKTPFDLQGVADGARQLIAYGFESENVIEDMRRLGDVAAGLGLPLQRLTYLYGTTRVQGRLYARDMLQFTNSGIPMLDQLAKMYGKTTKEINEMVSAGKIGFEDIKKAIYAMTSEGGQFANLMEKQSKTIGGQISNIGDSIDQMFNELGKKSEGVINNVLKLISTLVENYEKVGNVLGPIIAMWGTVKAAQMAYSAAIKVSNVMLGTHTALTLADAEAKLKQAASTTEAAAAQKMLNKALASSPAMIAATAAIGTGVALMKWAKAADKGTEGVKNFNAYVDKQTKGLEQLREETKKATDVLGDSTKSETARKDAMAKLIDLYPKIMRKYKDEEDALTHILDIKNQIAALDESNIVQSDIARLNQLNEQLEQTNENITIAERDPYGGQYIQGLRNKAKELNVEIDQLTQKLGDNLLFGPPKPSNVGGAAEVLRTVKQVTDEIKADEQRLKELRSKNKSGLTQKEVQEIKDLETSISKAEAEYKSLTGKSYGATSKTKAGDTDAAMRNASKRKQDLMNQLSREEIDLQMQLEQDSIDAMADGYTKRRKQNELAYDREMEQIRRAGEDKRAELIEQQKSLWLAENPNRKEENFVVDEEALTEAMKPYEAMYDKRTKSAMERLSKANEESYKEELNEYGTFLEKRALLEEQWDKRISEEKDEVLQQRLRDAKKAALAEYDLGDTKYQKFFSANLTLATDEVYRLAQEIKDNLNRQLKEGTLTVDEYARSWQEVEDKVKEVESKTKMLSQYLKGGFGGVFENMQNLGNQKQSQGSLDLRAAQDKFNEALKNGDKSAQELAKSDMAAAEAVQAEGAAMSSAAGQAMTTVAIIDTIIHGINDIVSGLSDTVNLFSDLADSFGADTSAGTGWGGAKNFFSTFAEASQYATDGWDSLKNGNIGGVIRGVVGSLTTWVTSFNRYKDAKFSKEIENDEKALQRLSVSYDKLNDSVNEAYGSNRRRFLEEQNANLEEQKKLIEDQIRLEEAKKKTDEDVLESYRKSLDEINEQIEENRRAAVDALFGADVQSAIADFSSAVSDAWVNGTDSATTANDYVKKVIQDMVTESVKGYIQANGQMDRIRQAFANAMTDDIITEEERRNVEAMAKDLADSVNAKYSWAEDFFADGDNRSASSKGLAGLTQDQGNELNGRFAVIQSHTFQMNETTKAIQAQNAVLVATTGSILQEVMGIHDDTRALDGKMTEVLNNQTKINTNLTWMIDKGLRVN